MSAQGARGTVTTPAPAALGRRAGPLLHGWTGWHSRNGLIGGHGGLIVCSLPYLVVLVWSLLAVRDRTSLAPLILEPGHGSRRVAWVWPGSVPWDQGVRAGATLHWLSGAQLPAGGTLPDAVLMVTTREGHTLRIDRLAQATAVAQESTAPLLLGAIFFLLAVLVYGRGRDRAAARAFALLFISGAMALTLVWPVGLGYPWAMALEVDMVTFFGSAWAVFFLTFPRRVTLPPFAWAGLLAVPVAAVSFTYAAAVAVDDGWYSVAQALRGLTVLGGLGVGCARLLFGLLRSRDPRERHLLVLLAVGIGLGISPFLLGTLLPAMLERPPLVNPRISILTLAALPLIFAHALIRHRLFGVTVQARRVAAQWGWGIALGAAALALAHGAVNTSSLALDRVTLGVGGVGVGVLVAVVVPRAWRLVDHLLFPDVYDQRRTLHDLTVMLAQPHDPRQMGTSLCRRLSADLGTTFGVLFTATDGPITLLASTGLVHDTLAAALAHEAAAHYTVDPTGPWQDAAGLGPLWVPLRTGGLLYGLLAVGPKRNGEPLTQRDRHLVRTIAATAAAALHGATLTEQLRQRTVQLSQLNRQVATAQEQERRALARDLHDGPLQRLTLVAHMLPTAHTEPAREMARRQSLAAIGELRRLCHTLRTSVLDDLGLVDAVEALVEEARPHTTATLSFVADERASVTRLGAVAEGALYRVAQEALANSLRHGSALAIAVDLAINDVAAGLCLRLAITDCGRGFDVPADPLSLTSSGHYGLAGMVERMQGLGGQLTIRSAVGEGTQVVATVPLVPEVVSDGCW